MRILVLNRGSSSVKCSLFDFSIFSNTFIAPIWEEKIEWKNIEKKGSIQRKLSALLSDKKIDCIGHRIVHGGQKYKECVPITRAVKNEIKKLDSLAPLHNLADLEGIEVLEKLFPGKPQFAVFDTAFHHTLPQSAAVYPGPRAWIKQGIRRYGFHGTSFQYCARRALDFSRAKRMVICHLGSGASLCAVKDGKSIDTTMGFTPLEGLMMDTRSGSIDPGILLYLLSKKKKTVKELSRVLYEKSGLLGLSQISSDMRDILASKETLTLDVYIHRLNSCIGSMVASLQGIETLVFTAGIGENAPLIRKRVCERLSFLGVKLDLKQNEVPHKTDCDLSLPDSNVKILLIHTQEAFEIARECWKKNS